MAATPEIIVWVAINIIGVLVFSWLFVISWERRLAVIIDDHVLYKNRRLKAVNKQLRNRFIGAFAHTVAIIIGLLPIFGLRIPINGTAWIGILIVTIIVLVATIDLYGEFR